MVLWFVYIWYSQIEAIVIAYGNWEYLDLIPIVRDINDHELSNYLNERNDNFRLTRITALPLCVISKPEENQKFSFHPIGNSS
ncbi:hypothetical protein CEXT_382991 [Caerostris extrusa]|uniref:Uncharacterized protein n=1 Tax=Caerostris extrusa TaxID=172846 RepID=A0AAV4PD50_CAEEX|nr:hypothetical protein CEXT_382991 [Caerostris extrusa]